jgi:hypothetical protein
MFVLLPVLSRATPPKVTSWATFPIWSVNAVTEFGSQADGTNTTVSYKFVKTILLEVLELSKSRKLFSHLWLYCLQSNLECRQKYLQFHQSFGSR